ncbi:ATP-binding protein [Pirellulales bacterium]|nr:ATP-binding protein [Pirellulales bacterium]
MTDSGKSFPVGMVFKEVHKTISERVYESPMSFLRENVQNALDAIRMHAHAVGMGSDDASFEIAIIASGDQCSIRDNGIGMSWEDLRDFFWTIGASGKRTAEAKEAGCVGMFGIGGFANFGVCDVLTVTSRKVSEDFGTLTRLTQNDIDNADTELPSVHVEDSSDANPRGTIVEGHFKGPANVDELRAYIADFVQFAKENVTFNGEKISQRDDFGAEQVRNLVPITPERTVWSEGAVEITGRMYTNQSDSAVIATISGLNISGEAFRITGVLRLEAGVINVYKRGFKLCGTSVQTLLGVSGRIDSDRMSPTAGRDSLDSNSIVLIKQIASCIENAAAQKIIASSQLLAQHPRVYQFVAQKGWWKLIGKSEVKLADGSSMLLEGVQQRASNGVGVYFGAQQKQALSQIMQARGNLVVMLPSERYRQQSVQAYLVHQCAAKPFSDVVEFLEVYESLDRFERVFLSELETTMRYDFEISNVDFATGKLTEDVPVYMTESKNAQPLKLLVDVRHPEIAKLRSLDFGPFLYSLIARFCHEYLGPSLRKQSPRFFGNGAMNLESLEKKRSELWVIMRNDVYTVARASKKESVNRTDVHTINVGGGGSSAPTSGKPITEKPKLLHITGTDEFADILGYYLRIPDSATAAFGEVIRQYEYRGASWGGNTILFVASDRGSSAFQFEVRLEHVVITVDENQIPSAEGAEEIHRSIQEIAGGMYFPLPTVLEPSLVPSGDEEIHIEVTSGNWIDTTSSQAWRAKED